MKKGIMIAFDGVNGSGKSGAIIKVKEALERKGFDVVTTREPGGTEIGEKIRDIILDPGSSAMSSITEVMLFAAGRHQHIQEFIIPAIDSGKIVLCDRFSASTYSFQQYARNMDKDMVKSINDIALSGFSPDKNIVFDLDPYVGMQRVTGRGEILERFELLAIEFHKKAREGFLNQAKESPDDFAIIDASPAQSEVIKSVLSEVFKTIREKNIKPKKSEWSPSPCE